MLKSNDISKKINPIVRKIQKNKIINGVMAGMMAGFPVTMLGSVCALLKNINLDIWQNFIKNTGILAFLDLGIIFSTNFIAPIFALCIAAGLAKGYKEDPVVPSLLALVSFLIVTPVTVTPGPYGTSYSLGFDWVGSTGMFSAIIIGISTSLLYIFISRKGWTIKMPNGVPPVVSNSFGSLIPAFIVLFLFMAISTIFTVTPFKTIHALIYGLIQVPLQGLGGNIISIILLMIICQLLWFFGIHGAMILFTIVGPILGSMDAAQLTAYSAGQPLPNIAGMQFMLIYTPIAGVMGLIILMLLAKSKQYKTLGKLALIPGIFSISEPVIFGAPIVLNIRFFIPWVFTNSITLTVAYILTKIGIVPRLSALGTNNVPLLLNGFIQGGWKVALLQAALIALSALIWYPFFRGVDMEAYQREINGESKASVEA